MKEVSLKYCHADLYEIITVWEDHSHNMLKKNIHSVWNKYASCSHSSLFTEYFVFKYLLGISAYKAVLEI